MDKLYERIDFINDSSPDLNESNLNAMSKALDDLDNRVIEIAPEELILQTKELTEYVEETKELVPQLEEDIEKAKENAIESQSWAVGGTGTREGEDTNNAKYWSEQSRQRSGNVHYADLPDKPLINNVTLEGNLTSADLGITASNLVGTESEIESIPDEELEDNQVAFITDDDEEGTPDMSIVDYVDEQIAEVNQNLAQYKLVEFSGTITQTGGSFGGYWGDLTADISSQISGELIALVPYFCAQTSDFNNVGIVAIESFANNSVRFRMNGKQSGAYTIKALAIYR